MILNTSFPQMPLIIADRVNLRISAKSAGAEKIEAVSKVKFETVSFYMASYWGWYIILGCFYFVTCNIFMNIWF